MYVLIMRSNYNIIRNIISSKLTPYLEAIDEEIVVLFLLLLLRWDYIPMRS